MIAEFIDPAILGFVLIGVMLFAIFIGFPISFTLIFLGFVFGYLGFGKLVFYLMTLQFSMVMTEQTLAAVPLFVFMGIMMEQAGLMERLFSAFQMMLARVKGSLYYAVLFVSVIFAGLLIWPLTFWNLKLNKSFFSFSRLSIICLFVSFFISFFFILNSFNKFTFYR